MKFLTFILCTLFISSSSWAQTKAKITTRLDLTKFQKISTEERKKPVDNIPDDEIPSTVTFVRLDVEVMQDSYDFINEPLVYSENRIQRQVINGDEEISLKFKVRNNGNVAARGINYNFSYESRNKEDISKIIDNNFTPILISQNHSSIEPGQDVIYEFKVKADKNIEPSQTTFTLEVNDKTRKGDEATTKGFGTDFFKSPNLKLNVFISETATDPRMEQNVDKKIDETMMLNC